MSNALQKRIARLEAASGQSESGPLVFDDLCDWAPRLIYKSQAECDAEFPRFRELALDRLANEGKIAERDRERVRFIVRVLHSPTPNAFRD